MTARKGKIFRYCLWIILIFPALLRKKYFLPAGLLIFAVQSGAQDYSYLHFLPQDGLPGNNIYSIVQDKDGFVWFATQTGLSRFDGSNFKNFTVKDGLPGNEITSLFVDYKNRVWIAPFCKDICYYFKGKIYNRNNSRLISRFPPLDESKAIAEDCNHRILIESNKYFILVDSNDRCSVYHDPVQHQISFTPVSGFHYLSGEVIAPGALPRDTTGGRCIYNFYNSHNYSRNVFSETPGYVIIRHDNGRYVYLEIPTRTISRYPFNDSLYIFNTRDGSFIYDLHTGKEVCTLLKGFYVNHTYIDREKGIWAGTHSSGVFYFPYGSSISKLHTDKGMTLLLRNFYNAGQKLISATGDGDLWQTDKQTCELKRVPAIPRNIDFLADASGCNIIKNPDDQLFKLAGLPDVFPQINESKSLAHVADTFLVAMSNCVIRILTGAKLSRVIWNGRATCAMLRNNYQYVGTLNGLFCFPSGDTSKHDETNTKQLIRGNINSMAYAKKQQLLWVSTTDNGVYCLDSNQHVVRNFNESTHLSGNICKCIFTDGNRVFAGTSSGLNMIQPDSNFEISRYYTSDGLAADDITCVYAEGNKIWAGTTEGLSCLDISTQPDKSYCRFNITAVLVSGRSLQQDTNNVILAAGDNNIEFQYSGISFRSMKHISYCYRLTGLHTDWQTTAQNYLRYPSLPAGDYTFEIFAVNRFGNRSRPAVFYFTIRQFWWQLWWVQFFGFIALITVIALSFRMRYMRARKRHLEKAEFKEQIADLEQRALRAQMNPHFIFNSLNSFYQYVINRDLQGASKFMNDFSRLIRLLFEITGLKEITLDKELVFLQTYLALEQTKLGNCFDYSVHTNDISLPAEDICIPTFIIQPFIENSVRHGIAALKDRRGNICITFKTGRDQLTVTIEDNGVGRAYNATLKQQQLQIQQSRGIALTAERIVLYNRKNNTNIHFEINDNIPAGTIVSIYFPLNSVV